MKVFNFDPDTGEFLGAEEAERNPLAPGEYLLPAHSTTIAPPEPRAFHAAVFNREAQRWDFVDVSNRQADYLLRDIARRLAEVGPLFDAYSDLAALGELDADGIDYLQALRLYRVQLRMVHQQPGFPKQVVMPEAPELRPMPYDPLRAGKGG